jgi:hypothetical protein
MFVVGGELMGLRWVTWFGVVVSFVTAVAIVRCPAISIQGEEVRVVPSRGLAKSFRVSEIEAVEFAPSLAGSALNDLGPERDRLPHIVRFRLHDGRVIDYYDGVAGVKDERKVVEEIRVIVGL